MAALLRRATLYTCRLRPHPPLRHRPPPHYFSTTTASPPSTPPPPNVEDVSNKDLKERIDAYFKGDEQALPSIAEAIFRRRLLRKHDETDDELIDELRMRPLTDIRDKEVESDFSDAYSTEEDLPDLYNATSYVKRKMISDEFFNMNDTKWDEMVREGVQEKLLSDTRDCEGILEDMLNWDKLLPDEIKRKVEIMIDELADMCEKGEVEEEQAYELYKAFEDKMVLECAEIEARKPPPEESEIAGKSKKIHLDDPPGEGPILRWESRIVFGPGEDAWHPKNRKVKLAVTVKELELSKYALRRLRELVGKRYHPGRDELTITSERFEHREENRKDCLRTLYSLIEEAVKADKQVDETRKDFLKDKLRANPKFMEKLKAKKTQVQVPQVAPE